jgi:hypothetical protein
MIVKDNRRLYKESEINRQRDDIKFKPFIARVLTVDYERHVVTLEELGSKIIYKEVFYSPAPYSSSTGGEVYMPEQYSACIACNLEYVSGFTNIVILNWLASDAVNRIDAVAQRSVEGTELQGYSDRLRGTYRKAFPGQKTSSFTGGFSEKVDQGWDQLASDFSRDKLDPDRRSHTQITSLKVQYTDAGLRFTGPVNRPGAPNILQEILPDGSTRQVLYLNNDGTLPIDRYQDGDSNIIAFSEKTERIQEFALDYALPMEVLQTALLDTVLGTTTDPWGTTTVISPSGQVAFDDLTFMTQQSWDHPDDTSQKPVGPTLSEGTTPSRRGFIIERAEGTLVGYNKFDTSTYGLVLKPSLFVGPPNQGAGSGRFGADVESGYFGVTDSTDHVEARLAASCYSMRFPYEYNTTRLDISKEGHTTLELGATLPKEGIGIGNGTYEYPFGAGRSLEAHLVGSAKLVVGKNRNEEEALDMQALGQAVIRLGADDTGLPNARRIVQTQIRGLGDAVSTRLLQYWDAQHVKLKPGDSGVDNQGYGKTGAENVSLRAGLDGGAVVRLGGRNPQALRRHLVNGYQDGPGKTQYAVSDSGRVDSHSPGRPNYGAGDSIYAFHNLTTVAQPQINMLPYNWSGAPITNADMTGLSLDVHAVRDILLRAGQNPATGQSFILDLAGGLVLALGKDLFGRSITAALDGGIEITIQPNAQGKALRLEINGDIDVTHKGNLNWQSTGDWVTEQTTWRNITKTDRIFTQQKSINASLTRSTEEAPDIVNNQGSQVPAPGDENS